MKLQNFFRTNVIAIGFGAALLFAGAAHAQEIDNPSFDPGANSVPMPYAQNASAANAANANSAAVVKSNAANADAVKAEEAPVVDQASVLTGGTSLRSLGLGMLAVVFAWAVLYVRTKGNERNAAASSEFRYMAKVHSLK
jgi:hypothetical protein